MGCQSCRLRHIAHISILTSISSDPTPRSLPMSRISVVLLVLLSVLMAKEVSGTTSNNAAAQDKKKKDKKDKKVTTQDKKDDKKEEKKEPFKPDQAQIELKGHTDWILGVAFTDSGKTLVSL